MADNELGEIRRSQILQNGPGAIVDFRAGEKGGGPVSIITSGLESWEETAKVFCLITDQNVIREPRLEMKLKKNHFRLSPAKLEERAEKDKYKPHILGVRFPTWLSCPDCGRLDEEYNFGRDIGDPSRWCVACSGTKDHRVHVVPTRFVIACDKGHISDFPWRWYLKFASSISTCAEKACKLFLKSDGLSSSLQSLILSCPVCKASCSMAGIFGPGALSSLQCSGERPWIGDQEDCGQSPSVIQRGASNIYFPIVASALSIPPWDDPLEQLFQWETPKNLDKLDKNERKEFIRSLSLLSPRYSIKKLTEAVERRISYANEKKYENLKKEEYMNFIESSNNHKKGFEFKISTQSVPSNLSRYFDKLVKVERLKEIRVQTGFTRLSPFLSFKDDTKIAALSESELDWLPASEVRGEGIFFSIDKNAIEKWLGSTHLINDRFKILETASEASEQIYNQQDFELSPTFVLLHTLSHIVIRQLSLTSGYNSAAIRERIYCSGNAPEMRGVLIYTGTSDSSGTLGGLARLSETDLFGRIIIDAIADAQWCSSDPLCIDGISSASESLNISACHACTFSPETSCDHFNMFLDRALLVGTPENPEIGFFSDILR